MLKTETACCCISKNMFKKSYLAERIRLKLNEKLKKLKLYAAYCILETGILHYWQSPECNIPCCQPQTELKTKVYVQCVKYMYCNSNLTEFI